MRWGIAGYGDVVTRRALPALRALGEEPVALWGRDARRASRIAGRYGVARSGTDPDLLLTGVDAVYVATPVAGHVPLARAVLDAGLPVLVEKPLAGGLGTGGTLDAAGRCAGVAYYRRLAPAVRRLRAELTGWTPERARVRFRSAFAPGARDPMRWRTDPAVSGGGVLADAGSHRVDLLLHLFGRPYEVTARLGDRFPAGAERRAELTLRWRSGLRAQCLLEWGGGPPVDRFELTGGGRAVLLDPLDAGRLARSTGRSLLLPPAPNPHQPLLADFAAAVEAGGTPVCPVAEARLVDDVIVAAERSDAAGAEPVLLRA
ncbi:Gfo/Idh/MocA family protein [Streptomyces alboniger]|uniref:Gfo/Idh/MocA family oxidoreductase n=1 Tax=Streptomyces alboniger TaxID=132473 RepID=A0A5J6HWC8_STRAD|nr:Gfo/Idh/MocA family oxidoreductase [Streptomyces alboniger]QEV21327.1 gfo/Idh/MocA family oxidoreductase [Streptomyces alboniger]